jgi:diketogulonate reductase-like aldo/keto reductase
MDPLLLALIVIALPGGSLARLIAAGSIPTVEIAPGVNLPMAGLGTWLYNDTRAEKASLLALQLGYTHIDTANDYGNAAGIGRAIKASGRARDSYFITSKVPGGLSATNTTAAHDLTLSQLGLDHVDLLLIHFPTTMSAKPVGSKAMRQEQWRAMESIFRAGKARAIGVSHFCERHLQDVLEIATIKPAVNQVQYHVGMGPSGPNANDFKAFDEKEGVLFQSFSPLCGPCMVGNSTTERDLSLINGKMVTEIGARHGKTGAQVSLKWLVQQGIPVIPKTDKKEHLLANMDLFGWELSTSEMATLTQADSPAVAGAGGNPPVSGDCTLP